MRVIIYTGKGGVGKTSMAAATAVRIAGEGKKVCIMSTDQAHSLGDSFECRIGGEVKQIAENLFAVETDVVAESEKSWGSIKDYFKTLLTIKGGSGIEAEELLVFPGLEELFAMFKILDLFDSGEYDTIIVDCAPTGETLSLLRYPERFAALINKVLPIERAGVRIVGPAVEKLMNVPMPGNSVFDDVEYLMDKMQRLQKLLTDKDTVSIRVVTTAEKIVISEAKRNFTCLYLYRYNVDAVIVNHIYPDRAMEGYFGKWMKLQKEGLKEIEESFSEVPRLYLELMPKELKGLDALNEAARLLFKDTDPDEVLFKNDIYISDSAAKTLKVYLPFADKEDLVLEQDDNELLIGVKNERRKFPLPYGFEGMDIAGAKFEEGYLNIRFE